MEREERWREKNINIGQGIDVEPAVIHQIPLGGICCC